MQSVILVTQVILATLITTAILLQSQGSGLGSTWGGGGETYHTRRGLEKVLFYFTIAGVILFTLVSIGYFLV